MMEFFNLNDGQSAIIRILSSSVDKIERGAIHTIQNSDGSKKKVRCLGDNCPLCANDNSPSNRLFVHLWDYTDNTEKVWNRTPNEKFINSLRTVEADWGPINSAVLRITRDGEDFPKYDVSTVNPKAYADVSNELIDKDVAWRCSTYRSANELNEFIKTGILPDHVKREGTGQWLPKEEWLKKQAFDNQESPTPEATREETTQKDFDTLNSFEDDFEDPFSKI